MSDQPKIKVVAKARPKVQVTPKVKVQAPNGRPVARARARPRADPVSAPIPSMDDLLSFPLYDLRKHAGLSDTELNTGLLETLNKLIDVTIKVKATLSGKDKAQQSRRINSFIRARDAIKDYKKPITSGSQAKREIGGVGKGIADRIDEYLRTGTLRELAMHLDPESEIIAELCTVTGIGEERAKTLIHKHGVSSVQDLMAKYDAGLVKVTANQLTHHIVVGLKYYHDLQQRMSWDEADQIAKLVTSLVQDISPDLVIHVCGSYRRHKPTCGDLDVLISHPAVEPQAQTPLPDIVSSLEHSGLLVGHLTSKGKTKYMGVCKLTPESTGRRIDIRFVDWHSLGAAMLYFTGSGKFNKIMRYYANQRGYTLNEYGLYRYINGHKGDQIPASTEEDIFNILNFVYLKPQEREF